VVYNQDVLFIHLGKTGGMSVTHYLCRALKPPVFCVINSDEIREDVQPKNIKIVPWKRHGNLLEARDFLLKSGIKLSDFKLILCVVRNPFQMDFSYYKHLRTGRYYNPLSHNPGNKSLLNSAKGDYESFAKQHFTHFKGNLNDYFEIDGIIPSNMKIVKFENFSVEIPELIRPYSVKKIPFPHENKSDSLVYCADRLFEHEIMSIRRKYHWIWKNIYPENETILRTRKAVAPDSSLKKYLFISGHDRSGILKLTRILSFHSEIVLGIDRYNNLMKKEKFGLTKNHFLKERFTSVHPGDTNYQDFFEKGIHKIIHQKWEKAKYIGTNFNDFDKIINDVFYVLGSVKAIYILSDIFSYFNEKLKVNLGVNPLTAEDDFSKIVNRWNQSLINITNSIESGDEIICLSHNELFQLPESLKNIFEWLGLEVEKQVLKKHGNLRNPTLAFARNVELSPLQRAYIVKNARIDLYNKLL